MGATTTSSNRQTAESFRSFVANSAVLFAVVGTAAVYSSGGGSSRNALLTSLLTNFIMVVGFHIFIGNTGVLSFGHLGLASVGSYVMALLSIPLARKAVILKSNAPFGIRDVVMDPRVATIIGILVATLVAALIGLVVARTSGLAATMISLALLFVVLQVADNWKTLTNGTGGLSSVPRLEGNGWPVAGSILAIGAAAWFRHSKAGRLAVATREDELAASAMGIDVFRPRFMAFVVSGAVVALGGILQTQSIGSIGPRQFAFEPTILILAMLVVGGMRTVSGALVGTVFITVGKEVMRFFGDGPRFLGFKWPKIEGLPDLFLAGALLLVLLTRPGGLMGEFDFGTLLRRFTRRASVGSNDSSGSAVALAGMALRATDLGITFGGFTAVDGVSFEVAPGTIHGLIGPNGAGKTTVVNLLTGIYAQTRGRVTLGSTEVAGAPHIRARQGIARTFQNLRVFGSLPVRENIAVADLVAAEYRKGRSGGPGVEELLEMSGLTDVADRPASTLDYGNQRRLEIARAAALRPDFLLLDEPTSGMSETESLAMVAHVRRIAAAIGAGVLVIDHDLGFITNICDRITVLDQGRVIAEGTSAEIQRNQQVIDAYLGSTSTTAIESEVRSGPLHRKDNDSDDNGSNNSYQNL
jgi:branched-chain amino acid transport system permease protein